MQIECTLHSRSCFVLRADSVDRTRGHTMMSVKKAYLEQLSLSDFFKSLGQLIDEAYF